MNQPMVIEINSNEVSQTTFEYNEKTYDAYNVSLQWKYKKDLGYDEEGSVTLVKMEDKLYVAEALDYDLHVLVYENSKELIDSDWTYFIDLDELYLNDGKLKNMW